MIILNSLTNNSTLTFGIVFLSYIIDNVLVTYLLFEKQKAEKSFWWPYITLLPKSFDWLIDWSKEEYLELQDATLIQDLKDEIKELFFISNILHECLVKYEEHFKEEGVSVEEIRWAYGVVYSRAFCKGVSKCGSW